MSMIVVLVLLQSTILSLVCSYRSRWFPLHHFTKPAPGCLYSESCPWLIYPTSDQSRVIRVASEMQRRFRSQPSWAASPSVNMLSWYLWKDLLHLVVYKHVYRGKIHKLVQVLNNIVTFAKRYGKAECAGRQQGQDPPGGAEQQLTGSLRWLQQGIVWWLISVTLQYVLIFIYSK